MVFYFFFLQLFILNFLTGESKFPECRRLPRVPKNGHSGKPIFPECCTRGTIALGEERLSRVPRLTGSRGRATLGKGPLPRVQHSGKSYTRGRKVLFDGPNQRCRFNLKWKKSSPSAKNNSRGRRPFPSVMTWLSGKMLASPSVVGLALGEEFSFFSFFCLIFFLRPFHII